MNRTILSTILGAIAILPRGGAWAQGCVAVRNMDCSASDPHAAGKDWAIGSRYRYFESFRHFVGRKEQTERVEQGTEVINDVHSLDLSLSHRMSRRLSAALDLPLYFYDRSSLYEHYGNSPAANPDHKRFTTRSRGIGDMRVSAVWQALPYSPDSRGTFSAGLGLKIPTGNPEVQDDFHRRTASGQDSTFRRPVDQSIQLGDAGWGFDIQLQGTLRLYKRLSLYGDGYYLFNPEETNNTLTRGTATGDRFTVNHSIADQYAARMGFSLELPWLLSANLGARGEGIPAYDILGGSKGFRRPGYIISVEPGLSYRFRDMEFNLSVPVAVSRNRITSASDDKNGRHGDAAFADYLILLGATYSFSLAPAGQGPGII